MTLRLEAAHPEFDHVREVGGGPRFPENVAFMLGAVWRCVQFLAELSYP